MKIIILDASETVCQKVELLLNDIACAECEIIIFSNAQEALDSIKEEGVDIIFSGVELEGIDGVTFVDLLLRYEPKLVSRLFIMSSSEQDTVFSDMKDVGGKRFIRKPIKDDYFKHFVIPEMQKITKGISL